MRQRNIHKSMGILVLLNILTLLLFQDDRGTTFANTTDPNCAFRVIGYYPDYDADVLPINEIEYEHLTDIIYFSVTPNTNGTLDLSYINATRQQQLVDSAHAYGINVSICVGGWDRSSNFSFVTSHAYWRTQFVKNLTNYCVDNGFDGIDLDWEPVTNSTDRDNYSLLIQELKESLSQHQKTLSVAVMSSGNEINTSAIPYIDCLHVMAYNMGFPHSTYEEAIESLAHWESFGFEKSKMVFGLPFYGKNVNGSSLTYNNIVKFYAPAPSVDWVNGFYFNGIHTINAKTEYALNNGYKGVMMWSVPDDTSDETSLLRIIAGTKNFATKPDFNCDGKIYIQDLSHLMNHWLDDDCSVDNIWCSSSDLDMSNTVNLHDFEIFSSAWRLGCPTPANGDFDDDCDIDLQDLSTFIQAWLSSAGDSNWNSICDISDPADNKINLLDLAVLTGSWSVNTL